MATQAEVKTDSVLLELAARCEQAAGADRELDRAIRDALEPGADRAWQDHQWGAPSYTASLDAAMTLVGPDVFFHLSRFSSGNGPANAHVYPNRCLGDDYEADAATPALALCAAALKARAAQGIEAQRATTVEQGVVHESPVGNADAPKSREG